MDLHGVTFAAVANSDGGTIGEETRMTFRRQEHYLVAEYFGGVAFGHVVATQKNPEHLDMLYHSIALDGSLQAGQASARLAMADGRRTMTLDWRWLTGDRSSGESAWVEVPDG